MAEKITLEVDGMTCANCANTITRELEKEGLNEVVVNFITKEVVFEEVTTDKLKAIKNRIDGLGYKVVKSPAVSNEESKEIDFDSSGSIHHSHDHLEKKFTWSLVFTVPLLLHMVLPHSFLHHPLVQLFLCIPVMAIGVQHFGKSAWGSLKAGLPNMDVLIFIGSSAAFVYSLAGMYLYANTPYVNNYLFFETGAAIITFVLLGNVLENRTIKKTTSAIEELIRLQPQSAVRISSVNGDEKRESVPIKLVGKGDILFVASGEKIPVDGKITWGEATIDESMMSGESIPVHKTISQSVTGGTMVIDGSVKLMAERVGAETTLAQIIRMVKDAQLSRPSIQKLGDRISNIFVPVVLSISAATFLFTFFLIDLGARESIMRSIAVLVIACPCAMGLATPTALMAGLGRAAKNGILIKGGNTVEQFAKIKTIVFDKTGTLTTGHFKLKNVHPINISKNEMLALVYSMEQYSSHPIAKALVSELNEFESFAKSLQWKSVKEDKGIGINAVDLHGNIFSLGSYTMAAHATNDAEHNLYLLKNNELTGYIDLEDDLKEDTSSTVSSLKKLNIETVLLSGDRESVCRNVAQRAGINQYFSRQLPHEKLSRIESFRQSGLTAMVGDGINDAPALAKADVGITVSGSSQVAIQSAQVVLLHKHKLGGLLHGLLLCKHTLLTIKQNLFWAFFYNVLAIPVAAFGYLSPAVAALAMAFSDVILIGNSIRLKYKRIK